MHLVLEQALERDTVPLPECQRGQGWGRLGPGDSMGGPLSAFPCLMVWGRPWRVAGRKGVALALPIKTSRLPPCWS